MNANVSAQHQKLYTHSSVQGGQELLSQVQLFFFFDDTFLMKYSILT